MKDSENIHEDVPEIPSELDRDSHRVFIPKIPFFMKEPSDQYISSTLPSPRKENMRMLKQEKNIIQEILDFKKEDESFSIESPRSPKKTTIAHNLGLNELVQIFFYYYLF